MPGSVMSEKICRLCLHREGDFFDLFAPSIKGLANLVDQLEPILNFKIVNDVRLPRVICSNCYKIQAFINEFRISCSRINGYLNELIDVSAPNSRDGPWEQTAIPVVNNEQSYDNAPEKKSKPMKPSVDDVKSCITDDESGKNLNPLVCEENMKEKLGNSSNSSVVSDGKTWKKNLKTNRVETSQPPMHSNTIQRSSTIDEKKEHFRFFELKDTYVRTAASISDRMKELNGRSMKYVRNNNSPGDSGCKDISETPPLEDEDTIELKLAPEYFLKTGITEEINVTNKVVNEAMGEDHHWNPGELHTVELQVKNEDVGLGGFDFNKLEEAPQMESINHGTRAYGSNSLFCQQSYLTICLLANELK
ncbi:uncharacterized protein [Hetaerina americana]|uniref:uncharacterized protein n=1 Tax=Hetaerina americana TaxID=62018 RepID=UPI003A7F1077